MMFAGNGGVANSAGVVDATLTGFVRRPELAES